jgi:hypothetical protein
MACSLSGGCEYFGQEHMEQLTGLASLYKNRYCDGDHARCARHRVLTTFGAGAVPRDMRPNDHMLAAEMLDNVAV